MNDPYQITMHWAPETGIDIFLLKVSENIHHINLDIIPQSQRKNIEKYHQEFDRNKRLLARSFLFEYCKNNGSTPVFDFAFNKHLRPYFKHSFTHSKIKFSLSYSHEYVLIGISKGKDIGVDIEYKNNKLGFDNIAPLVMHEDEIKFFKALSNEGKQHYFYTLWSGKESLIKSWGKGLYHPVTKINLMARNSDTFVYEDSNYLYSPLESIEHYALAVSCER